MSVLLGTCWQCEGCSNKDNQAPWNCNGCGKEVCEYCFDRYALCKECSRGKTDDECKKLSGREWDE